MCVVNSRLLLHKAHGSTIKQATFRAKVAKGLYKVSVKKFFRRGRPLNDIEQQHQQKRRLRNTLACKNVHLDSINDWPEQVANR